MTTKDKNWRYESWATNRPSISKEEKKKIVKDFYDKPAASSKRLASTNTEPSYSDDYMEMMVPIDELEDIKKTLNVSPMVRIKKPNLRKGLPNILLADASNKPPTLEDYLRLGMSLAQLSDEERKNIQWMLDRSMPEEK